ncbi:pilus assembly protein PilP [Yersinia enterocolitica]|uniref:pilus assembly protein PilP n=1 Tax=Yersinia TaxID=629 RepID=UPI0005E9011C|nr:MULTISPECIES: pilus assembly protein PilP [Yersinia]MCB5319635.1 pilus assembly protein PilP [Yersinia massiliensis]CNL67877.1 membrane protein [Yersinia frederiksenii]CQH52845.1 membrane protein [Yersinia frederiksenii]
MNKYRRVPGLRVTTLLVSTLVATVYAETTVSTKVAERNPFQKVSKKSCHLDRERLASWQLQGIVSGGGYQSSWGKWPDGDRQKLVVGQQLLPNWQVIHIGSRQVSLQQLNPDTTCTGLPSTQVLSMR